MITVRRANERHHDRHGKRDAWLTFHAGNGAPPIGHGLGILEIFSEVHLPPGASIPRYPRRETEIITYVREGTLAYEDAKGRPGVLCAGEFQRMTPGRGVRRNETNASRTDWAHVFQVGFYPSQAGPDAGHEQKRFSSAERRGLLCTVGSPDSRRGSLRIHQDAVMQSALLDPGQHLVHELTLGRSAWFHVVDGKVTVGDFVLTTGDGAGITAERAISITAQNRSEVLLIDVAGTAESGRRVPTRSTRPVRSRLRPPGSALR